MFLLKPIKLEWANKILVSSAKIICAEVLFIILGKSFIQGVPGGMDKTSGECSLC
jgi:hypothetical protein